MNIDVIPTLIDQYRETFEGEVQPGMCWITDGARETALFGTLDALTPQQAFAPPAPGAKSIAEDQDCLEPEWHVHPFARTRNWLNEMPYRGSKALMRKMFLTTSSMRRMENGRFVHGESFARGIVPAGAGAKHFVGRSRVRQSE